MLRRFAEVNEIYQFSGVHSPDIQTKFAIDVSRAGEMADTEDLTCLEKLSAPDGNTDVDGVKVGETLTA